MPASGRLRPPTQQDRSYADRSALRLTLVYVCLSVLWILLSDRAVMVLFRDPGQIELAATLKGWGFVAVTGALLFGLTRAMLVRLATLRGAEQDAREDRLLAEVRYRALMEDAVPDSVFIHDHAGTLIEANRRACEIMGYSREELLRMSVSDLEQEHDIGQLQALWSRILPGQPFRLVGQARHKDGHRFPVEVQLGLMEPSGARIYIALVHDISDRVAAETQRDQAIAALEAHRRDLEATVREKTAEVLELYNRAPCGYHSLDADGRIIKINDTELKWLGYSRDELPLGMPVTDLLTPASRELFLRTFPRVVAGQEQRLLEDAGLELEFVRRNGSVMPLLVHANIVRGPDGGFLHTLSTSIDNSARKAHERQFMELNRLLNEVLEALPVGVAAFDARRCVRLRNGLFGILQGLPDELLAREPLFQDDLVRFAHARGDFPGRELEAVLAETAAEMRDRAPFTHDRLQANEVFLEVRGTPISQGWTLLTYHDMTAPKRIEQNFRAAREVAETATRAKSDFLANMSHEIRTPINGILGLCYLMERQELAPAAREMLQRLKVAGQGLLLIVNDILDFSKIEAGRLETESVPFRLSEILERVASMMASTVGDKPLELIIGPAPPGADELVGDPLRLGQVLTNLASNAVKFTQQGEVVVKVTCLASNSSPDGPLRLEFSVADSGVGIQPDKLRAIFSPFEQGDTSTTRRFGGTGLGLAISRRLVELMGGELRVASEPGKGSRFSFELELRTGVVAPPVAQAPSPLRLLIADDHRASREALADAAASLGWTARPVASGAEAVEACALREEVPDVVVLDWQMPRLDGLQAAARIRAQTGLAGVPIVVMATVQERAMLQEAPGVDGVDAMLTKPVTPSALFQAVEEARRSRARTVVPALSSPPTGRLAGLRLLVVDDSDLNRDVAGSILRGEGAEVDVAADGAQALARLEAGPGDFHLVLMDMQMPVMDGYEATRHIRANPRLMALPVIALTAGAFRAQRELAMQAGVNDYVAKPFEVGQLVAAIARLAAGRRGRGSAAVSPPGPEVQPQAGLPQPSLPGMQLDQALQVWRQPERYAGFLRRFVEAYGQCVDRLRTAAPAEAAHLAHKLQGAAGSVYLPGVTARARELEAALTGAGAAAAHFDALQLELGIALASVAKWLRQQAATEDHGATAAGEGDAAGQLRHLLAELDTDEPDRIEDALQELVAVVGRARCEDIRAAVQAFDFRGGEQAVRRLAAELGVGLEDSE